MKKEIRNLPLIHPTPIVVVGTMVKGIPNYTTIGDVAVAGLNPALVMISLNEQHCSTKSVLESKKMSINITTNEMLKEVDFAGIYSGKDTDKNGLFKSIIIDDLPVISVSPISLIVKVMEKIQIKQRVIFICEVTKTLVDESLIVDAKLELKSIKPILYGLDNNYYTIGKKIGVGYQEGKKII